LLNEISFHKHVELGLHPQLFVHDHVIHDQFVVLIVALEIIRFDEGFAGDNLL
jgi:hypothetical protein